MDADIIRTKETHADWTVVVAQLYDLLAKPTAITVFGVVTVGGGSLNETMVNKINDESLVLNTLEQLYGGKITSSFGNVYNRPGYGRGYARSELIILGSSTMRQMIDLES